VSDIESDNKTTDYGKVAVMMGGRSAERDISIESGEAVLAALLRSGVDAHKIDVQNNIFNDIDGCNFDRVFIALHGRGGEDGTIQGALDTIQMPYTGSNVLGSALAMDKCRSKRIWKSAGLPTPEFIELFEKSDWQQVSDELGLPLMVKPVREGSSFGATKVKVVEELESAWREAYQYDNQVMAECWIEGPEFTAPILDGEVLPLIRLVTPREFYDYQAKYQDNTTQYICPCGLDQKREKELAELAIGAFTLLGASGWGRVDFILDEEGSPWLIELNTVPGMTSHSLVPMAAKQAGVEFDELVLRILNSSLKK